MAGAVCEVQTAKVLHPAAFPDANPEGASSITKPETIKDMSRLGTGFRLES